MAFPNRGAQAYMRPTIVARNKFKRGGKPEEIADETKKQLAERGELSEIDEKANESVPKL